MPIPCSSICNGTSETFVVFIPNSFNKSVLPEWDVILLFPCLMTGILALATINDTVVEILKLFDLSPVPHTHILPSYVG